MPAELCDKEPEQNNADPGAMKTALPNVEESDHEENLVVPFDKETGDDEFTIEELIEQSPDEMAEALDTFVELPCVELGVFFTTRERCQAFCDNYHAPELTHKLWSLAQVSHTLVAGWAFSNTQAAKRHKVDPLRLNLLTLQLSKPPSASERRLLGTIRSAEKLALSCVSPKKAPVFQDCKFRQNALEARVVKECTALLLQLGALSTSQLRIWSCLEVPCVTRLKWNFNT